MTIQALKAAARKTLGEYVKQRSQNQTVTDTQARTCVDVLMVVEDLRQPEAAKE